MAAQRAGDLLTADASLITDADGLTGVAFTFVWMAGATNDPAQATIRIYSHGPRYHVDPLDAGLKIMVDVRFRDDTDNFESVLSATTGVVAAVAPAPPLSVTASSTAPGELSLRWLPPYWMLRDWLAGRPSIGDGGSDITGYKVQWKRSTGSWTVPADVSEETATDTRHAVRNLTGSAEYTLRVIAINAAGDSPPSHEVTVTLNRFPTGAPTLTGTPRVGEVLTIGTSGITDGDGLTNPGFAMSGTSTRSHRTTSSSASTAGPPIAAGVSESLVEAEEEQLKATAVVKPPDADGDDANGHQVALQDISEITITVTSPDGSRTRAYRVTLESPLVEFELDTGFNEVAWPGADGAPIADALRDISDRVVVAYAWDEATQTWRIYVPDLPEVPALNTLTVLEQGRTYWIAAAEPLTWAVATR